MTGKPYTTPTVFGSNLAMKDRHVVYCSIHKAYVDTFQPVKRQMYTYVAACAKLGKRFDVYSFTEQAQMSGGFIFTTSTAVFECSTLTTLKIHEVHFFYRTRIRTAQIRTQTRPSNE